MVTNNKISITYNSNTRNINAELSYTSTKLTKKKTWIWKWTLPMNWAKINVKGRKLAKKEKLMRLKWRTSQILFQVSRNSTLLLIFGCCRSFDSAFTSVRTCVKISIPFTSSPRLENLSMILTAKSFPLSLCIQRRTTLDNPLK